MNAYRGGLVEAKVCNCTYHNLFAVCDPKAEDNFMSTHISLSNRRAAYYLKLLGRWTDVTYPKQILLPQFTTMNMYQQDDINCGRLHSCSIMRSYECYSIMLAFPCILFCLESMQLRVCSSTEGAIRPQQLASILYFTFEN